MHQSRRPAGRLVSLSAAGALALSALLVPAAVAQEEDVVSTIDVLGITDFHGRIEADGQSAGAASLAAAVNSFRAANPDRVLFASSGDSIGASTFTSFVAQDQPTIDVLNAMDLDVSALGNHEFDAGRADLDDRVIDGAGGAAFPYLAANLYEAGTTDHAYDPYATFDVGGVSVGFIGAMTEDLPSLVSPDGIESLDVGPIVPAVEDAVADLTDGEVGNGEADIIVLLLHEGATTQILGGLPAEVDAVFAGHTHGTRAETVSVGSWEGVVIQAGKYGEHLAQVSFGLDADDELVHVEYELHDLVAADGNPVFEADTDNAMEGAVLDIVAGAVAQAEVLGAAPLGLIDNDFRRAVQTDGSENRGGESTLGNLVADVHLWAANDAGFDTQIAFMNPGGLREDLLAGDDGVVTYREAAEVQPFANTLVSLELTGAQVLEVLEQQWQPEGSSRPFLKLGVSGLTYTYDPTAPAGERITGVSVDTVAPDGEISWQDLDPAATYSVVANSFLAGGGDSFSAFAEGTGHRDTGRVDLQAMVDYLATFAPVDGDQRLTPGFIQRAVGVVVDEAPAEGWAAGDEVTVSLSSLVYSAAGDAADTVELAIGPDVVASAPIDPSVVDGTDEQGRATLTFTVPAGLTGDTAEVWIMVPELWAAPFTIPLAPAAVVPTPEPTPTSAPDPGAQPAPEPGVRPAPGRNAGLRVETGR